MKLLDKLFSTAPQAMQDSMLRDARIELLHAEANAEYWVAMTGVLKQRVARLQPASKEELVKFVRDYVQGGVMKVGDLVLYAVALAVLVLFLWAFKQSPY